jgi:beta-glucanase (GH16 family)
MICSNYPHEVNTNVHNWTDISVNQEGENTHPDSGKAFDFDTIDFSKEYHLFGLEWSSDEVIFYLDRKEIRREKNLFCLSPAPLLLSLAILTWAGEVTDKIDGTYMEVDYVRVYRKK